MRKLPDRLQCLLIQSPVVEMLDQQIFPLF